MSIECVELRLDGILRRAMPVTKSKCCFYILFVEYLYCSELSVSTMVVWKKRDIEMQKIRRDSVSNVTFDTVDCGKFEVFGARSFVSNYFWSTFVDNIDVFDCRLSDVVIYT